MPEAPTSSEINSKTDSSVAKQWDTTTPISTQLTDLYALIDGTQLCMLNTHRAGTGFVGRAMALAARRGPDLLFLANAHSDKFADIEKEKHVQVTFSDAMGKGWASVTGEVVKAGHDDPRVRELWSKGVSAWFGDLGDGSEYDGSANDPRMAIIEVRSSYVSYWKKTTGTLGFVKEVGVAALTGQVAQTGLSRRLEGEVLAREREREREGSR